MLRPSQIQTCRFGIIMSDANLPVLSKTADNNRCVVLAPPSLDFVSVVRDALLSPSISPLDDEYVIYVTCELAAGDSLSAGVLFIQEMIPRGISRCAS